MASRAEKFEDEKRRIIESCFARRDEDGSILETYITHIRIVEYSSHPTSPPPPQARTASSEKPRVIIVAVRKSGRVRMHKSKENPNGSFSIGKTWNLDDLSAIESFTGPNTALDYRQWAGDVGFIVTLGKPYYWQAQTDKEKKFFIASLIKIYAKYTGGRTPTLSGFDPQEEDMVLGGLQRRPGQPPLQQFSPQPDRQNNAPGRLPTRSPGPGAGRMPPPPAERSQVPPPARSPFLPERSPMPEQQQQQQQQQPPPMVVMPGSRGGYGGRDGARDGSRDTARSAPDYRGSPPRPQPKVGQDGTASPAASFDSTRSADRTALRRLAGSNKSQDSVAASLTARSEDGGSITTTRSRDPPPPSNGSGRFGGGSSSDLTVTRDERPPERKRPPMDPGRPQGYSDDALVPAPLMSSGMRRDREPAVPPRSVARKPSVASRAESRPGTARSEASSLQERSVVDSPGRFDAVPARSPVPGPSPANGSFSKPPTPKPIVVAAPPSPAPPSAVEPSPPPPKTPVEEKATSPEEEERPGLGPMIRKKKSKGDIQGVFWKAAAAAGGFKPRAGGAAEKLRQAALSAKTSEGPDGITGVVPAPPRPASLEKPQEQSPLTEIPEVTVTPSQSTAAPAFEVKELEKSAKKETEQDTSRQSVVSGNDVKYLATLGVDPSVLDSRSAEFTKWLDYFGWVPGEQMRSRNFEDLRIDIDRELNRAQAGGWLARFREEDERVDAIKRGIDLSIQECEEMDNLLTLYSVELSVSSPCVFWVFLLFEKIH